MDVVWFVVALIWAGALILAAVLMDVIIKIGRWRP